MGKYKKYIWMAGLCCALPLTVSGQQVEPLTGADRLFNEGRELFLRQDYAAARQTLVRYTRQAGEKAWADEVDYMLACTAYELKMPDCREVLSDYLEAHPESRYRNRVQALIGVSYFSEEKYMETIATLKGCDISLLSDEERDASALRMGTSYLKVGKLQDAAFWFAVLKETSKDFHNDAVYNLAYIDYVQQKYDTALQGFREVQDDRKFQKLAPYYIADIYLIQGNYAQARKVADAYLALYPEEKHAAQMSRISGEAAYGQKDYAAAIQSLERYHEAEEVPARLAMYKLGMSYFNTGVYSKALSRLGEATGAQDALAQNAYLHMGLAGLQLKERNQARMAFEQASRMDFDRSIQEQALFNYALCIHETSYSPFAESVTVFERFLNEYPSSVYAEKVNDYLVEVYMNTRSYEVALRSIEKITHPSARILEAKQKLLFRMGTQLFAQADYRNAIDYFTRSLQLGQYNQKTKADAYYWRGESKYRLERYPEAANDMRLYLEFATDKNSQEYGLALYCLGYSLFKQKQYNSARDWFVRCVQNGRTQEASVAGDAYNRIGDCYFYERRFEEARQQYAQAVVTSPSLGDYSLFQEGIVKGLQRDYAGKIQVLNKLITDYPSSAYLDDALYEQGRAFVQMEDSENAIKRYSLLVQRYPESELSRKAANEIGLLYYQNDRYEEAIAAYKQVITKYPGSAEARLAQRDLKSIYVDLNKVDDYMAFASTVPGGATFNVSERDSLTYTAAERAYMRGDIAGAKTSLTRYLQSFPQGAFSVDASYYLGLIDYNQKDYAAASARLEEVLRFSGSKYEGKALALCADMAYNQKEYAKALNLYKRLADRSAVQEERLQAEVGALRSACALGDRAETVTTASALLKQSKLTPEVRSEALYFRAKALLAEGQKKAALADLTELAKDTRNVYGAEAKYLVAQTYFDEGETAKAEKEVLEYIEVSTPHAYWLARSFVLLSDVYVKLDRKMEAKQYLLSLQQNYQADDDIAGMIESRLEKLKSVK